MIEDELGRLDSAEVTVEIVDRLTWYADMDSDGYGNSSIDTLACFKPDHFVLDSTDCDDSIDTINPGAMEVCDSIDNNCNGLIDDMDSTVVGQPLWFYDSDGDGFGNAAIDSLTCWEPEHFVVNAEDCNDNDSLINPTIQEICDGLDNNCDGNVDEGFPTICCQCVDLLSDVSAGFVIDSFPVNYYRFVPTALHDNCDSVTWNWGDGTPDTVVAANDTVYHQFNPQMAVDTVVVCMQVKRTSPQGFTCSEASCVTLRLESPTAVTDFISQPIRLYPNPANRMITVQLPSSFQQFSKMELKIVDILGIRKGTYSCGNQREITIELTDLVDGIYFLACYKHGRLIMAHRFVKGK